MPDANRPPLDLRSIPAAIINLPGQTLRRQHMQDLFARLGIRHQFIDGVSKHGKKRNVAAAMMKAHDAFPAAPFLVCEDDLLLMQPDVILPPPPADADILYLAKSDHGCLPNRPEYAELYRHHAYPGFALAEAHDENYLRLSSMISAIAVLVLTENGRQRYRQELRKAFNRDMHIDVRYALTMPDLRVYAPRLPLFAEDMALQPGPKRNEERRLITHSPLPVASEGERRTGESKLFRIEVAARRNAATAALEWEVVNAWPKQPAETVATPEGEDAD
jgi:hypothetical protein